MQPVEQEKRKVGRPRKQTDARQKLLEHARELFVVMPYDKVSTRLIAQRAGVNIAMIRYYFGNKEGLFETMVRETIAPMKNKMDEVFMKGDHRNLFDFMRIYYHEMNKVPQFPRLVAQIMHMPPSATQRRLFEKVFVDLARPDHDLMFGRLQQAGYLRDDIDPKLCKVSFISLMVFPFVAPPAMLQLHGIELNEVFLDELLEHNISLLSRALLRDPTND
ncbi:TetR/AcrR family transcriptional regulator [Vibrio mediterranei]|uniref:TetR/AcrR family transcriptional regulator n=1 Tax=Vibrio mediterranei TaxID=689 RepID=UPI0017F5F6E9|nr:TetR/AcrR family transcriptional regulator [Vibrio mediterranei]NUW71283.1 TetR/AcrR family transcriptional regulator [Vibrio mediterranei]